MTHFYDDSIIIPTLNQQISLLPEDPSLSVKETNTYFSAPDIDLSVYDNFVLAISGGKDSWACLLHLLDLGVKPDQIELWHHLPDGAEGSTLMDWPFMHDYNKKLAGHFGIPIYYSWLQGGFEQEMLKENSYSQPHKIETPDGLITLERDTSRSGPSTRLKFPQVGASLLTRWCSSSLKIDVARRAINNQERFNNSKTLFITGERRQESSNRAKYNQLEPHACDRRGGRKSRLVDAWRPVLHWDEEQVWDVMERHGIIAPVPYRLGWGRSSCRTCIFNSPTIWSTLYHHFPGSLEPVAAYEKQFDNTISRDRINVIDIAKKAEPLEIEDEEAFQQALSTEYTLPIQCDPSEWKLPAGAFFSGGCGPS